MIDIQHHQYNPQHIFSGGNAWYYRAFDEKHSEFRTFRFSRTSEVKKFEARRAARLDRECERQVILPLAPYGGQPNPSVHALDLGMEDKPVTNVVVAGFVLTDLRVDCSSSGSLDPFEYPLRLMIRSELTAADSMAIAPGYRPRAT